MNDNRFARVLVIGAAGQLGSEVMRALAEHDPAGPPRAELEIEDPDAVRAAFRRYRPTLVVNTAAFHKVEQCESEVDLATAVNELAVERLAEHCAESGAVFAHVSTDYVFGGEKSTPYDETDEPHPLNVYGASKLAGERALQRVLDRHFIFRTSGLFGRTGQSTKGPTFVERMVQMAEHGQSPKVVNDIAFSPSYAPHVAAAMAAVMATDRFGLYHVTNAGACTWYELAVEAVRQSGNLVEVIPTQSHSEGGARRPANSALAHGALLRNGFNDLPAWQAGVAAYLSQRVTA